MDKDSIHVLIQDIKYSLDYLITDHLDPKDGTHHKIQLPLCAEIIQEQLKSIYRLVERVENCTSFQVIFK